MQPVCDCGHDLPNLVDSGDISALVESLLKDIFKGKNIATANTELRQYFATRLWEAIIEGFGRDFVSVDFTTPNWHMLASLQRDVVHFSSAKDYTMQRAIANELIDEEGRLRTYSQFRKAAYELSDEHVHQWLEAEYNLSVSSGQMASKWQQIIDNQDVFPLLQFDVVLDDGTTEICRPLDGIIRPVSDPIWDVFFPPNHWGCRTTVRQLTHGEVTPSSEIEYPNIHPMFQVNLAKQGLAYPADHPYYRGLPPEYGELKLLRKQTMNFARDRYDGYRSEMDQIGEVAVSWQGIKEIANQPHYNKVLQLQLLQSLPQLMERAEFINTVTSEKAGSARQFHNFSVKGLSDIFLIVRELASTGELQLYSIVDRLKGF